MGPLAEFTGDLALALLNLILALIGTAALVRAVLFFKEGMITKSLKRGFAIVIPFTLHFFFNVLTVAEVIPDTVLDEILELTTLVGIAYTFYGFVNDWRSFDGSSRIED